MLHEVNISIPRWIVIVSWLVGALGLFVGASLYVSPAAFFPDIDFSDPKVQFLTRMWAARQVAIAAGILYSVARKSSRMLMVTLGIYCLMNLQDIWIGMSLSDPGLFVGAGFFATVSGSMVTQLYRSQEGAAGNS
jgi:hypothetical protein